MGEEIIKEEYIKYLKSMFTNFARTISFDDFIPNAKIHNNNKVNEYLELELNGKYGLIAKDGSLVLPFRCESLNFVTSSIVGIKSNNKWALYNIESQTFVTDFEYNKVDEFNNGLIIVQKGVLLGIINENGKFILECKYYSIISMGYSNDYIINNGEGWFKIYLNDKSHLYRLEYDFIEEYVGDYAIVRKNGKYGLIDKNGREVIECKYENINLFNMQHPFLGVAKVEGRCMPILKEINNGSYTGRYKLITTRFDDIIQTDYSFYIVIQNGKYGLTDSEFKPILYCEYDGIEVISPYLIKIKDNLGLKLMDVKSKSIYNVYYEEIEALDKDGTVIKVKKDGKYGVILPFFYRQTEIECKYDEIKDFKEYIRNERFYIARKGTKYGIVKAYYTGVNKTEYVVEEITEFIYDDIFFADSQRIIVKQNGICTILNTDLEEIKLSMSIFEREQVDSKKTLFSYQMQDKDTELKLKYMPIYNFDNIVICCNSNILFSLNKSTMEYKKILQDEKLDTTKMKVYGNIFLYNDKRYYVSKENVVDLLGYEPEDFGVELEEIVSLLSFDEFKAKSLENPDFRESIESKIKEAKIEQKRKEEIEQAEYRKSELRMSAQKDKENAMKLAEEIKEQMVILAKLLEQFNILNKGYNLDVQKTYIPSEALLVEVDDHFEISPTYLSLNALKFIDFSLISLDNVKVSGIDFTGCNASINPQTVYKKDMTNGIYSGLNFDFASFNGVNISGSDFSDCFYVNSSNAIMNERTVLPNRMYK